MSFFFSFCFFGFVSNWDPLFSLNKQNHFCRRRRAIENFSFYDLEVGEVGEVHISNVSSPSDQRSCELYVSLWKIAVRKSRAKLVTESVNQLDRSISQRRGLILPSLPCCSKCSTNVVWSSTGISFKGKRERTDRRIKG